MTAPAELLLQTDEESLLSLSDEEWRARIHEFKIIDPDTGAVLSDFDPAGGAVPDEQWVKQLLSIRLHRKALADAYEAALKVEHSQLEKLAAKAKRRYQCIDERYSQLLERFVKAQGPGKNWQCVSGRLQLTDTGGELIVLDDRATAWLEDVLPEAVDRVVRISDVRSALKAGRLKIEQLLSLPWFGVSPRETRLNIIQKAPPKNPASTGNDDGPTG